MEKCQLVPVWPIIVNKLGEKRTEGEAYCWVSRMALELDYSQGVMVYGTKYDEELSWWRFLNSELHTQATATTSLRHV
jgi:hypothetical protein